jgi:hypothetical protein
MMSPSSGWLVEFNICMLLCLLEHVKHVSPTLSRKKRAKQNRIPYTFGTREYGLELLTSQACGCFNPDQLKLQLHT